MSNKIDRLSHFLLCNVKLPKYIACSRARGITNKLPLEQRKKHYSNIAAHQNKLRADIRRLAGIKYENLSNYLQAHRRLDSH
jgi:hypothetical protein